MKLKLLLVFMVATLSSCKTTYPPPYQSESESLESILTDSEKDPEIQVPMTWLSSENLEKEF